MQALVNLSTFVNFNFVIKRYPVQFIKIGH